MKSKVGYFLLIIIPFICVFIINSNNYRLYEYSVLAFGLNSLISIIVGVVSLKRRRVIAIILILLGALGAMLFLHNLSSGEPPKGSNAEIKAGITNIRAQAQVVFEAANPHSFKEVCTNELVINLLKSVKERSKTVSCFSDENSFVVKAKLKTIEGSNTYWCVDSTGFSKGIIENKAVIINSADNMCS